ncbi:arylsulfatase [Nonomuraea sp. PA05]|uniref:arylsulfatase n=1 Tax=Nonomuraea sp. PA05 TaxID=2604466 RepID=UPI0011D72D76|nr:arylsulfatase [Nonomuraea sp. PA05]TYB57025.1 arylsulfatase [Nonomuraea sp. PA05]
MNRTFNGVINLDVRDSVPDWDPFLPPRAREGSPNVLYIVWDDTGIATWDTFGGLVETPNMTRLAKSGLRFTNWHTTALCSPTRSSLLTGRNAHSNGMACIVEGANGFPGLSAVIPPENGTLAEILVEHGYVTLCLGKWHLTPETESSMASSRRTWPTSRGFERFYGFLGGETNQWFPDLAYDQHFVEQPYSPQEGYHLSRDLADRAIEFIRDIRQVDPDKPWFCYFAPGANHAPHHAPKDWIDKYRGVFDMGYERYREIVLDRMKEQGLVPGGTRLSPINPWPADVIPPGDQVKPWDSLTEDERRLFRRMAEVFAAFCAYTDHQIGRLLDYLEESGQLDDTIVVVVSDNGASGEGSPDGSVNENKFFNGWPEDPAENLAKLDLLGGPDTYNHYPTGWAWAFNAPYKMFKRYTLEGGIADPLIISWPGRMKDVGGQVRDQYHHAIDIVPTVLDLVGVEPPRQIKGHTQSPIQGTSMAYTFDAPQAPSSRTTQYYAMLGTRALYHDGWKVVARHGALSGKGDFMADAWELYHVAEDRAETRDLSAEHPDRVRRLVGIWFAEAGANGVFPLDDRTSREQLAVQRPLPAKPREVYVYYPGTSDVPEGVAVNIRNRSFSIKAELDADSPDGVIFAQGSRFGGHTLFVKNGALHYCYNFLGAGEQTFTADRPLPAGPMSVGVEFAKEGEEPEGVARGRLRLFVGDEVVAEGAMRTQPGKFALAGEGLCVGRDSADPVSGDYSAPYPFTGGTLKKVTVNVSGEHYVDHDLEGRAMLARD